MKMNRTYSIDEDLVDMLQKEDNASRLINQLLSDYYGATKESIERRKREALNKLKAVEAEEEELAIVENENKYQRSLRERKEAAQAKKKIDMDKELKALEVKCKAKEMTFTEYRIEGQKIREKWGCKR